MNAMPKLLTSTVKALNRVMLTKMAVRLPDESGM
jgi:hypothetical protein